MVNLEAFTAKQLLLTDNDTRSVQELRKMFETLDRKNTLAEIAKQALRQISQWENTKKGYTDQIHRQFGAKTLTAAKYTGILDTVNYPS